MLLNGRFLPPAEGRASDHRRGAARFDPAPLLDRYGLGIAELDTPSGPLVGHAGGIPGFLSMTLSTTDGRRQLAVMVNVGDRAPAQLVDAYIRAFTELGTRLPSS